MPLRFRALNNPGSTEQTAQSENISQRGMYFYDRCSAESRNARGSVASHAARAGREVSSDVKCVARVVHVRPSAAPGGMSGIGLHIERYEAKASVRERWAS